MKQFKYYIILLTLVVSCKHAEKENINSQKIVLNKSSDTIVPEEQYLVNDALVSKMQSDLDEFVKNPKFKIEKELVENRHVDNLIDTVQVFTFDKTIIESYKAVSEEFIFAAQIQNVEFEFSKSIKIGMDKNAFEKIINTKVNSDIIRVENLEEISSFIFKFQNEVITEIIYEGYLD